MGFLNKKENNKKENKIQVTLDIHDNSLRKNFLISVKNSHHENNSHPDNNFIFEIKTRQKTINEYVKCQEQHVKVKKKIIDGKISLFSNMVLYPREKLTLLEREHLIYTFKESLKQKTTPTMNFMELKENFINLIVFLTIPISSVFSVLSLFPIIINESKLPLTIEKGSLVALRERNSKRIHLSTSIFEKSRLEKELKRYSAHVSKFLQEQFRIPISQKEFMNKSFFPFNGGIVKLIYHPLLLSSRVQANNLFLAKFKKFSKFFSENGFSFWESISPPFLYCPSPPFHVLSVSQCFNFFVYIKQHIFLHESLKLPFLNQGEISNIQYFRKRRKYMRDLSKYPWNASFREFTHEDIITLRNSFNLSHLAQFLLEVVDEKRIAPHVLLALFCGENTLNFNSDIEKSKKIGNKNKEDNKNRKNDVLELF